MNTFMCAFVVLLLVSAPCLAQESLIGSYKLVGVYRDLDGKPEPQPQNPPHGYLVITPKIYVLFFTDAGRRKYGDSDARERRCGGP